MALHFHYANPTEKRAAFAAVHSIWPHAEDPHVHLLRRLHAVQQSRAEWYVGVEDQKVLVSCGLYPLQLFGPDDERQAKAIGAVFTDPPARGRGLAQQMLTEVMRLEEARGIDNFILFSDITPRFYETIGFHALPSWEFDIPAQPLSLESPWRLQQVPVDASNPGRMNHPFGILRSREDDIWVYAKQDGLLRKTIFRNSDESLAYWLVSHTKESVYTLLESSIPNDLANWSLFKDLVAADCAEQRAHRALGWWTEDASHYPLTREIRKRSTGILMWRSPLGVNDPWMPRLLHSAFRAFPSDQV